MSGLAPPEKQKYYIDARVINHVLLVKVTKKKPMSSLLSDWIAPFGENEGESTVQYCVHNSLIEQTKKAMADVERTNPLFGRFDEVVGAVLGVTPRIKPAVMSWDVSLKEIYDNSDKRLDASHYDQDTALAIEELKATGYTLKPLSAMASLTLPSQFVRIWAKEKAYGYPYVNATDLMSLMGIGSLSEEPRYLSRETDVDMEALIIREGWLLVSCSGTIGRVFYVPERLDGWVGTHDLIRVIPNKGVPAGFLHAYLASPVAQKQILGHTHGGQIDHITDAQIGTTLVPELPDDIVKSTHEKTMSALKMREQAISQLATISTGMRQGLK